MALQKGLLLSNLSKKKTFSECLLGMILNPPLLQEQIVSKIILKRDQRDGILERLREKMGVDGPRLKPPAPGLDEFAGSLRDGLRSSLAREEDEFRKSLVDRMKSRNAARRRSKHP
jgi:hypothetical protein